MGFLEALEAQKSGLEYLQKQDAATVAVERIGSETDEKVLLGKNRWTFKTTYTYHHHRVTISSSKFYTHMFMLGATAKEKQASFNFISTGKSKRELAIELLGKVDKAIRRIKDPKVARATLGHRTIIVRQILWIVEENYRYRVFTVVERRIV